MLIVESAKELNHSTVHLAMLERSILGEDVTNVLFLYSQQSKGALIPMRDA